MGGGVEKNMNYDTHRPHPCEWLARTVEHKPHFQGTSTPFELEVDGVGANDTIKARYNEEMLEKFKSF